MHFKQSLFLNEKKFTSLYIEPLKKLLSKLYKKKIVLNLIKLKNYFLNSDILTQIITKKTSRRNSRILKVLNASIAKLQTPVFNKRYILRTPTKYKFIGTQNTLVKNISENLNATKISQDNLSKFINENYKENTSETILNSIQNKTVSGVRLKASGRLTKRIVAARSISKLRWVGTLKNIDSSYRGLSSTMLRGYIRSNTQLTKLKSKTRIGSFGIKGWVSTT